MGNFEPAEQSNPYVPRTTKFFDEKKLNVLEQKIDSEFGKLLDELDYIQKNNLTNLQKQIPADIYERIRRLRASKTDFTAAWIHDYDADQLEDIYKNVINIANSSINEVKTVLEANGFSTSIIISDNRSYLKIELPSTMAKTTYKNIYFDPIGLYTVEPKSPDDKYFDLADIKRIFDL